MMLIDDSRFNDAWGGTPGPCLVSRELYRIQEQPFNRYRREAPQNGELVHLLAGYWDQAMPGVYGEYFTVIVVVSADPLRQKNWWGVRPHHLEYVGVPDETD